MRCILAAASLAADYSITTLLNGSGIPQRDVSSSELAPLAIRCVALFYVFYRVVAYFRRFRAAKSMPRILSGKISRRNLSSLEERFISLGEPLATISISRAPRLMFDG